MLDELQRQADEAAAEFGGAETARSQEQIEIDEVCQAHGSMPGNCWQGRDLAGRRLQVAEQIWEALKTSKK